MNKNTTIQDQNGSIVITGELNFGTVMNLWRDSLPLLKQHPRLHFDLSGVNASNSAGLALILEWIKYAKQTEKPIQFSHIPAQLDSIIAVAGLSHLFKTLSLH